VQPSSVWFGVLVATVTLAVLAAAVLTWDIGRWKRTRRFFTLTLTQLLVVITVMVGVNIQQAFFVTWDDLLGNQAPDVSNETLVKAPDRGSEGNISPSLAAHASQLGPAVAAAEKDARRRPGHGVMVATTITGPRTGYSLPARLYLPAAYFDPAQPDRRFPVIEFFTGYLGSLDIFQLRLGGNQVLDKLIAEGKMPPVVVVIPEQNTSRPKDSECVDAVDGDRADTYSAFDVPDVVMKDLRVSKKREDWVLMGYSTGGFCAANLALRHPDRFGVVVSMSGYFRPLVDKSTGDLYKGDEATKRANNPMHAIGQRRAWPLRFYLFTSGGDREGVPALREFSRKIKQPDTAKVLVEGKGGHNFGVWQRALPATFTWIGQNVGLRDTLASDKAALPRGNADARPR
jgi:enterochelin esterase-like enzyme